MYTVKEYSKSKYTACQRDSTNMEAKMSVQGVVVHQTNTFFLFCFLGEITYIRYVQNHKVYIHMYNKSLTQTSGVTAKLGLSSLKY